MARDIDQALARTALLIERDLLPGAGHGLIVGGLRDTTARIIASRSNVDNLAGQVALTTLYGQLAMMGLHVDLDVADAPLIREQPPYRGDRLCTALVDYSDDLLPGGSSRSGAEPDITFALGDSPAPTSAVRVSGTEWRAHVAGGVEGSRWRGTGPVGAMAAAATAAADGLRAALPNIAGRVHRPAPSDPSLTFNPTRQVAIDLTRYAVEGPIGLGEVDVISGGAITNAMFYAVRRFADIRGRFRVFEPDVLDLPNLNRYPLARRSQVGALKAAVLEELGTVGLQIRGLPIRFDESAASTLGPVAPRVLVGVDHIPSRWAVQRAAPSSWVAVGATSHFFVLSSAHPAGRPCAGCTHPKDDHQVGEIPTISFVSFWAGLMQSLELVYETVVRCRTATPVTTVTNLWPLGLGGKFGIHPQVQLPLAACPVQCGASTAAHRLVSPRR